METTYDKAECLVSKYILGLRSGHCLEHVQSLFRAGYIRNMIRHVQNMFRAPRKFLEGSQNSLEGFGYVQIIFEFLLKRHISSTLKTKVGR